VLFLEITLYIIGALSIASTYFSDNKADR